MEHLKPHDYTILQNVLVGLILFNKVPARYVRILLLLLCVTAFVELASPFGILKFKGSNHLLYNIFTPVQFVLFTCVFVAEPGFPKKSKFVPFSLFIVIGFSLVNLLWIQGYTGFNSYTFILSCIFITLFSFISLTRLYSSDSNFEFFRAPIFWISVGILFFFPTNIFSTGLITEIYSKYKQLAKDLYKINDLLNVVMYSCFLIAIIFSASNSNSHHERK